MALVSLSRCSSDDRSSGGAFGFATSGGALSFLGGCAAGAGGAGVFAGAFATGGAVCPVEAGADGVAESFAGPALRFQVGLRRSGAARSEAGATWPRVPRLRSRAVADCSDGGWMAGLPALRSPTSGARRQVRRRPPVRHRFVGMNLDNAVAHASIRICPSAHHSTHDGVVVTPARPRTRIHADRSPTPLPSRARHRRASGYRAS